MFQTLDAFPPDAVGGADFFTGTAARRIPTDDGQGLRDEIIVVADRELVAEDMYEGRVCISETTVRHMGALVGLYSGGEMAKIVGQNRALTLERDLLTEQVKALREQVEAVARDRDAAQQLIGVSVIGALDPPKPLDLNVEAIPEPQGAQA